MLLRIFELDKSLDMPEGGTLNCVSLEQHGLVLWKQFSDESDEPDRSRLVFEDLGREAALWQI